MNDKRYSGNLYKTDRTEEAPDDCPSCIYRDKETKKDPDEYPNCYYTPSKKKRGGWK